MMQRGWTRIVIGIVLGFLLHVDSAAHAQDVGAQPLSSPILTLDQDALFSGSKYGQALRAALNAESAKVEAESRRLDSELEAEERALTQQRAEMSPEAFAPLAATFDAKVQRLRAEREQAAADLLAREVAGRQRFFETSAQVLRDIMVERGAVAIIDKRAILVSLSTMDVTEAVIEELDSVLGDGADLTP